MTVPTPPPSEVLAARVAELRERIGSAGGDPDRVTIVAVTKTFPVEFARAAVDAGLLDLGENYAQDLAARAEEAAAIGLTPRWHFIGGLQRNKIKLLAGRVALWQTIDRDVLVTELAKRDPGARILIQVNTTGEQQKSGCAPGDARELVEQARAAGLDVAGLMTVGPTGGADPRPAFDALRELGARCEVAELSMGMSGDYELAVAAGATMIRVGSVLFGPRTPR
ncbi:MAG: YggS family pyridoxal phosphate-dependent enzyme [Actinomycetota bacterium]